MISFLHRKVTKIDVFRTTDAFFKPSAVPEHPCFSKERPSPFYLKLSEEKEVKDDVSLSDAPLAHRLFDTIQGSQGREGRRKFECRAGKERESEQRRSFRAVGRGRGMKQVPLRSRSEHRRSGDIFAALLFVPSFLPFFPSVPLT